MNVKIARTHLWKYKVIIKLYIEAKLIKTVVWVQDRQRDQWNRESRNRHFTYKEKWQSRELPSINGPIKIREPRGKIGGYIKVTKVSFTKIVFKWIIYVNNK